MAIKNFTVKTKQVKKKSGGLDRMLRYLVDEKAPSHKQTNIIDLHFGDDLVDAYDKRRAERQRLGIRGGGVQNYATSFIVSLPDDIGHPDKKTWKNILKTIIIKTAETNGLDPKTLANHSRAVIHDESKSGKNSHIHLVVSNIIDKKHIKGITQNKTTWAVKHGFNEAVKRFLGVDYQHYKTKKQQSKEKQQKEDQKAVDDMLRDVENFNKKQKKNNVLQGEKNQPGGRKRKRRKR